MPRIYTTKPGAEIVIGNLGTATNETGVIVSRRLAAEFEGRDDLRVEHIRAASPEKSTSYRRGSRR